MFEPLFYFQATIIGIIAVQNPVAPLFVAILLSLAVGDIPLVFWASLGGCQMAIMAQKHLHIRFKPELAALFMGCTVFSYSHADWDLPVITKLLLFPFIATIATGTTLLYLTVPIFIISLVCTYYFEALEHQLPFLLLVGFFPSMLNFFWAPKKEEKKKAEEKKE